MQKEETIQIPIQRSRSKSDTYIHEIMEMEEFTFMNYSSWPIISFYERKRWKREKK